MLTQEDLAAMVAFTHARLDEDEQAARAANEGPWKVARSRRAEDDEMAILSGESEIVGAGYEGGGVWANEDAEHIARHDPARVLREVQAKREFLDFAVRTRDLAEQQPTEGQARELRVKWASYLTAVKFEALRYADHPDYREEWRP